MSDEPTRDDGGQAFPRAGYDGPSHSGASINGMSLRDYFAAKAMQAILSRPLDERGNHPVNIAEESYRFAKAMLEARK